MDISNIVRSDRYGIYLKIRGNFLRVESLNVNCPFRNLTVGDVILSINRIPISDNLIIPQIQQLLEMDISTIESCSYRTMIFRRNNERNNNSEALSFWNVPCDFGCGYNHFHLSSNEKTKCCLEGTITYEAIMYPKLKPLPPNLREIFQNPSKFSSISSTYNNILAMGATGVDNGKGGGFEHDMHGNHAVKLNGRTYHFFPTTTSSTTEPSGGLSYFMFDAQAAMMAHANSAPGNNGIGNERIDNERLMQIYTELQQKNYLCQELQQIGEHAHAAENTRTLLADINQSITYFEVALIKDDSATGNRCLRVKLRGATETSNIQLTSGFLEPVSYPIFFPHGEMGWSAELRKTIEFMPYLCSRILMPEYNEDGSPFTCPSKKNPTIRIHCNRFQAAARLKQVYLVDMVSRAIDFRLRWNSNNQTKIFGGELQLRYNADLHITEPVDECERRTFLPSSFHGGRRHLKKLASNALAIVSELGNPSLFITLTCNPNWPEIQELLLEGQTAFDREDLVCQVFKNKLDKVLEKIRNGSYFGPHTIAYIMRVIEYQHRGMPHCHIVVKLRDVPTIQSNGLTAVSNWIDENISARMPPTLHGNSTPDEIKYRLYVETHMIHKCSIAPNGCKDSTTCKCKRGYEDTSIETVTRFDEKGFPIYKRDFLCDLDVVPHNKFLLLDWNGHCNVEYAGNSQCVLYLYKYLYKGAKKVKLRLTNAEDVSDNDEITLYLRGRFLCAMDAMWRTLGYQTYPASNPSVQTISVKMPEMVQFLLHDKKSCDMLIYFNRPTQLRHLKYTELFKSYTVTNKLSSRFVNEDENNLMGYFIINITGLQTLYLQSRSDRTKPSIIRMEMLYVTSGA